MKKLDSKLQKQQHGWPKISNTARKYNKDENLENYNSEVQMYARVHSGPRLANLNHLRLSARRELRVRKVQISNHKVFSFNLELICRALVLNGPKPF